MPVNTYETMLLIDHAKMTADAESVKQQFHNILERHGATIIVSREWNYNQKLAYPINKQKKGAFHIVYYTMETANQTGLERDFKLAEGVIIRAMTLAVDPKWNEAILSIARDEHGKEFALRGMQEEATVTTDPTAIGGDMPFEGEGGHGGPRRGPRREPSEKHD